MSSIFISHNYQDRPFAKKLANDLGKFGIRVWLDEAEIKIGDSLIEKIQTGIDEMEFLGVILSNNSIKSEWVKREVEMAMNHEIKRKRVKVLPILIERCPLPGFLEGKLYADFTLTSNYGEQVLVLIETILGCKIGTITRLEATAKTNQFGAIDDIISGVPAPNHVLESLTSFLFSVLDGSYLYLSRDEEILEFASYISCFSERFNGAAYALYYVAISQENADFIVCSAIFGLAIGRNNLSK